MKSALGSATANQRRLAVAGIAGVLLGYILASPLVLAHFLLFNPVQVTAYDESGLKASGVYGTRLEFAAKDGNLLVGYYFEKPNAKYVAIFHHGQCGNIQTQFGMAKMLMASGLSVFTYDYRGYGQSAGSASIRNVRQDAIEATRFLVESKGVKSNSIIQCGFSLGTATACDAADSRDCAGVILISPYTSIRKVAKENLPYLAIYPRFLFPIEDLGCMEFFENNRTKPVLIIHGDQDQVIASSHALELNKLAKAPCSLQIEPGVRHGDFKLAKLQVAVEKWLHSI